MKKFFLPLIAIFALVINVSCSDDSDIFNSSDNNLNKENEIENLKLNNINKEKTNVEDFDKSVTSCAAAFYSTHPSFDYSFKFNEPIVISWDGFLCGDPIPDFISISFRKANGLPTTRYIATNLPYEHKTNPNLPYRNLVWYANDYYLEEGVDYEMILSNPNGTIYDYRDFTINGNYSPANCNVIVNNELDGDYNIEFSINNGNTCYSNIRYNIDFGDGTTTYINSSTNILTFSHQYQIGLNSLYNVSIKKYNNSTIGTSNSLSQTYITVRAKMD